MEQQTIIIQHNDGVLKMGEVAYCGLCDQPIGFLNKDLYLPFKILEFTAALENSSIGLRVDKGIPMSVFHKTCQGDIFITLGQLTFTNPQQNAEITPKTAVN